MKEEKTTKYEPLFSKTISIKGKHCAQMKALVNEFNLDSSKCLFKRNLDVYLLAPLVGKLYNRKGVKESSNDDTKIFLEQLNGEYDRLMFNYRLIVFLEDQNEVDLGERCNRAFRYDKNMEKREYGDKIFESYVLGGIEFLYEKLIEGAVGDDDFVRNIYNFVNNYYDLIGNEISTDELYELCRLASK